MRKLADFIRQNDNYLLLTHKNPDGDTIGSAVALCAGLRSMGKTAYIAPNSGINPLTALYIEGLESPEDFTPGTVISVDVAVRELLPENTKGLTVDYRIDHHPTRTDYALNTYTDTSAAACTEVVVELLDTLGIDITLRMAKALYFGLTTDTACFRNANTTARSHLLAARLINLGLNTFEIDEAVFFSKTIGRLQTEAYIINGMEYLASGMIAVGKLPLVVLTELGVSEDDLDNLTGLSRIVSGVKVGIMLREEKNGCKISLRTANPYDAGLICSVLGGGGHMRAAGCFIKNAGCEEARDRILEACAQSYPELAL